MSVSIKISVIIPTLHEEKVLAATLGQFTDAMRKEFCVEIIVSDGGSTDQTIEIAKKYADSVVQHSPASEQNISQGRNEGAEVARGNILIFLNADVMIEEPEKFFSTIQRVMDSYNVAGATCNVNIYPEEERFFDWAFHNFYNGYFWLLNMLGLGMGRGECHVIRSDVFREIGGYDKNITAGEDFELFLRLKRKGKIVFMRTLTVFESPRRFRKYGYLWVTIIWLLNAIGVLFFRRSVVDQWKPVR
jgi:glycosyltransferase involved in cell wall biosynthesis